SLAEKMAIVVGDEGARPEHADEAPHLLLALEGRHRHPVERERYEDDQAHQEAVGPRELQPRRQAFVHLDSALASSRPSPALRPRFSSKIDSALASSRASPALRPRFSSKIDSALASSRA